jgi:hypothetical protein
MTRIALAIIVSTALVCDVIANVTDSDSQGWDLTATIICVWAAWQWHREART